MERDSEKSSLPSSNPANNGTSTNKDLPNSSISHKEKKINSSSNDKSVNRGKGVRGKPSTSTSKSITQPVHECQAPAPPPPPPPQVIDSDTSTEFEDDDESKDNNDEEIEEASTTKWECSVCTFHNSPEAFKCLMCDVRKGTSTRKPRINPQLVAQQVARQQQQIQQQVLKAAARQSNDGSRSGLGEKRSSLKGPSSPSSSIGAASTSSADVTVSSLASATKRRHSDPDLLLSSAGPSKSTKISKKEKPSTTPSKVKTNKASSTAVSSQTKSKKISKVLKNGKPPVIILGKLKNIDRKNPRMSEVTVNNVTVVITEFKAKKKKPPVDKSKNGSTDHTGDKPATTSAGSSSKKSSGTPKEGKVSTKSNKEPKEPRKKPSTVHSSAKSEAKKEINHGSGNVTSKPNGASSSSNGNHDHQVTQSKSET